MTTEEQLRDQVEDVRRSLRALIHKCICDDIVTIAEMRIWIRDEEYNQ
jgi:hypothetical protein